MNVANIAHFNENKWGKNMLCNINIEVAERYYRLGDWEDLRVGNCECVNTGRQLSFGIPCSDEYQVITYSEIDA